MRQEKDPRRVIQGMRARAQGNRFEQVIEASFRRLEDEEKASASKTPEPIKILSQPDSRGQFRACFLKKAEPDFKGVMNGGRAIIFEAKTTSTGKLEQGIVLQKQAEKLDMYEKAGAHCFILASFDGIMAYRIPWSVWKRMKVIYGRKYMTEDEARPYRLNMGPGYTFDPLQGIATQDNFNRGDAPTLEEILEAFCGLPHGCADDGLLWSRAYNRLVNIIDAAGRLTEMKVGKIIDRLDEIDHRDGEV